TVRLEARIALTLPALGREMALLRHGRPFDPRLTPLIDPGATVHDSIALMRALYDAPPVLDDPYDIVLEPAGAAAIRTERLAREKNELQAALKQLLQSETTTHTPREGEAVSLELSTDGGDGDEV